MNYRGRRAFAAAVCLLGACAERPKNDSEPVSEWPHYGQSQAGLRYSPLTQITPANVGDLEIAWMYRIGGLPKIQGLLMPALEATPIVADGRMFLCSSTNKVVALDPETGGELWTHDPKIGLEGQTLLTCRGVTYFRDANAPAGSACAARIFMGTQDARLLSLDAATGKPCAAFGRAGEIALASGRGIE